MSLAENVDFLSLLPKPGDWPLYGRGLRGDVQTPLTEMRGFGSNPGNLRMFAFVPAKLQQPRALVVVLHGCGQTAASYDHGAGWSTLARHYGFALLLPQQQTSNNANGCFNWFNRDDIVRGRGEACSIRQMVARMVRDYAIDPRRVFVTGLSAGGAMASAMLATHPDVFAAGAIIAGLPFGVAGNFREALTVMRSGSGRTASALGDLVRNASKHRGPWPKVSVWHGSADRTVNPGNADEITKQWLDVHQLPEAPMSEGVVDGHPHQVWWNADGQTVIESYTINDMAHGTPLGRGHDDRRYGKEGAFLLEAGISSSYHIAKFFGLTHWIRDAKPAPAESPSAKLIPPVSPISAVALPELSKVLQPLISSAAPSEPQSAAEVRSEALPDAEPKRRRIIGDISAALERVLAAAGLKS